MPEARTRTVARCFGRFVMAACCTATLGVVPARAATPEVQAIVAANNQFALDLYQQLRRQDGNLFFSPYSINKTLAMVYAGARGATAAELAAVLHFTLGQDRQHRAFLETRQLLNRNLGVRSGVGPAIWIKPDVELYLAANLWGQRGCIFEGGFLNLLRKCYGTEVQTVDFGAAEQARQTINAWVEKETRSRIQDLLPPDTINQDTRLVLASAIYFKGDWVQPFPKNGTRSEPFWLTASRQVQVPLMNQTARLGYFENDQLQGLQMPYRGKNQTLIVLLPKEREGLADLERTLTAAALATWMRQAREQRVEVALPKCKLTSQFALEDTLAALGLRKVFRNGAADLSGMNGGRETLFLSAVRHKAVLDVNEEGTEAAAATGAVVSHTISLPQRPVGPVFRADHPFVLAICDVRTGVILFLGRVVQP